MPALLLIKLCSILLLLLPFPTFAADPDPLQDFCVADVTASLQINGYPCKPPNQVTVDDFSFGGLRESANTKNKLGSGLIQANVQQFPGLNTLGMSMARLDIAAGGVNAPHYHPRASQMLLVAKGKVLTGFLTTDDKLLSKVLVEGDIFVIPRGLLHFQQNVGKGNATIYISYNSQKGGVVMLPKNLFASNPGIPDEVLARVFQMQKWLVRSIKSKFRKSKS